MLPTKLGAIPFYFFRTKLAISFSPSEAKGFCSCHTRSYNTTSDFVNITCAPQKKVKTKYDNLPSNSIIKKPNSSLRSKASRITMSHSDIIEILYGLVSNNEIKHCFHIPGKFNLPCAKQNILFFK